MGYYWTIAVRLEVATMSAPPLTGIDHIHVYVSDREQAAAWYHRVLGFTPVPALQFWAEDVNGPLTLADASGTIHLALFRRDAPGPDDAIAFAASGPAFLQWKDYLEEQGLLLRCSDHSVCWSLYFQGPDYNRHEITTADYQFVASALAAEQ